MEEISSRATGEASIVA